MRMQLFYAATAASIFVMSFLAGNNSVAAGLKPSLGIPTFQMTSNAKLFNASRSPASNLNNLDLQTELDRFLGVKKSASAKRDWEIMPNGAIEFDRNLWTASKDDEGSEVFILKKLNGATEQKRTVIRNDDQSIRTISEYRLADNKENYWFVFFLDQQLAAATTCTDKTSDGLRSCTTAIPAVCKSLPTKKTATWILPKAIVPDVDLVEKRALATVLSMRGEVHQMENMAKTGNLIGLKHKLQTTRGRLTAAPVKTEFIQQTAQLCTRMNRKVPATFW